MFNYQQYGLIIEQVPPGGVQGNATAFVSVVRSDILRIVEIVAYILLVTIVNVY